MKKKEKLVVLVLLIITMALVVVGIVTKKTNDTQIANNNKNNSSEEEEIPSADDKNAIILEDGTRLNTSSVLNKDKTLDGITYSDIQLIEKDSVSELLTKATNTTNEVKGGYKVKLTFLDENNEEIVSVNGNISELKPGESTKFQTNATFDLANSYDFRIEKQ